MTGAMGTQCKSKSNPTRAENATAAACQCASRVEVPRQRPYMCCMLWANKLPTHVVSLHHKSFLAVKFSLSLWHSSFGFHHKNTAWRVPQDTEKVCNRSILACCLVVCVRVLVYKACSHMWLYWYSLLIFHVGTGSAVTTAWGASTPLTTVAQGSMRKSYGPAGPCASFFSCEESPLCLYDCSPYARLSYNLDPFCVLEYLYSVAVDASLPLLIKNKSEMIQKRDIKLIHRFMLLQKARSCTH